MLVSFISDQSIYHSHSEHMIRHPWIYNWFIAEQYTLKLMIAEIDFAKRIYYIFFHCGAIISPFLYNRW